MQFGIDRLLDDRALRAELRGRRLALVAHPASVDARLVHTMDALAGADDFNMVCAFGPQHGMRGDKQDNMIESAHYLDPVHRIPVHSLYAETRRPRADMLDFEELLFDLQDIGCRIYTYITTLRYMMEACAERGRRLWVLDRPNPAGRPVDGLKLLPGEESFVGCDELPTRHGLTTGELARWFQRRHGLDLDLRVVAMRDYRPSALPDYGWPLERPWINPSPNASSINMARCFPGTVLLEGTTLSEGRGTTVPLEVVGAPDLDVDRVLAAMEMLAPPWLEGATLRRCHFEPTFHKHVGKLCSGVQIHATGASYRHEAFRPFRLMALLLKALRTVAPDYDLWRQHQYEYEPERLPIDVINGGPGLREWVDDPGSAVADLEKQLSLDEAWWREQRDDVLLYPS